MSENGLMTLSAVAAVLGVNRVTVSDIAAKKGITPKPMSNGKAKGLNEQDRQIIADALKPACTTV